VRCLNSPLNLERAPYHPDAPSPRVRFGALDSHAEPVASTSTVNPFAARWLARDVSDHPETPVLDCTIWTARI